MGASDVPFRRTPDSDTIAPPELEVKREMSDYRIHSEPRAGQWVAWVLATDGDKPAGAVILPGQTQDEAEMNAQRWADRVAKDPRLLRDQ